MSKIAVIHPKFKKGHGVDRVIYETCKRLSNKYDISIFTLESNYEPLPGIDIRIMRNVPVKDYGKQILLTMLHMLLNPDSFSQYDLVWIHSVPLTISALYIKRKHNIPILCTFHGIRTISDPRLLVYKIIARLTFNKIDLIIGVSDFVVREARGYGANAIKIYNGCDLERFQPTFEDEGYMLSVGELTTHKMVNVPIAISSELGIPLKVVGDGPERGRLEQYAKRVKANAEFYGIVDELSLLKMYQKCSFFVSGSVHEAFGLAFIEAGACGKPSIVRNCTAMPEVIRHGETGFLCNNFSEYIHYSRLLWENEGTRREMGKKATWYAKKFSWETAAKKYNTVIESIKKR